MLPTTSMTCQLSISKKYIEGKYVCIPIKRAEVGKQTSFKSPQIAIPGFIPQSQISKFLRSAGPQLAKPQIRKSQISSKYCTTFSKTVLKVVFFSYFFIMSRTKLN